jgi:hypothetical protein
LRLPADRQVIALRLLPIVSPEGGSPIGYAAAALVSQQNKSAMLEVAHFNPKAKERAEEYTHYLEQTLQKRGYLTLGYNRDIEGTIDWLTRQARANRLNGEWNPLTPEQREHLNNGASNIVHTYNELHMVSTTGLREQSYER